MVLDAEKAKMTDDIKEYEYAKAQGYGGSFQSYQKTLKSAGSAVGSSGVITKRVAENNGLPSSLIGTKLEDLVYEFGNSRPPTWFKAMNAGQSETQVKALWQATRSSDDAIALKSRFSGSAKKATSSGSGKNRAKDVIDSNL